MSITIDQVAHVAKLAKLAFDEKDQEKMTRELGAILTYVDKLGELDTTGVEPMSHTSEVTNVMREDRVGTSLPREVALKNAPDAQDGYFKVPKVIK
ncbi:MAG TPA: Asp-tRNA(Asn)/Glu-tRNA(Gln) amidotransferase subunit GatC [Calditrichia bacterium]|nr:Asp-tRNA(Asn)/Glu-tRNA(Gln) amidotransferase subunit GatC [Calditrichota bacterium]HQU74815.1 Asp-tRNA(Asn)/Glu-tRNA(Gln) amidotransferase subunit GatC [Calditrichia bacterium]HQV32254.1 Asp-tRNA(Asn)/Glu-tRNA(Gln) amidotransferase subunit GatC [Calditrichia bacterium]